MPDKQIETISRNLVLVRVMFIIFLVSGVAAAQSASRSATLSTAEIQAQFGLPSERPTAHLAFTSGAKERAEQQNGTDAAYTGFTYLPYNYGPIMQTSKIYLIFWEPPQLQDGRASGVPANFNNIMYQYVVDINGSKLLQTQTQYWMLTNSGYSYVQNSVSYGGYYLDTTTPYPRNACWNQITQYNCVRDDQIQAEIQKAIRVNNWTGGYNNLFIVYTGRGEGSCSGWYQNGVCTPKNAAYRDYCGYHQYYNGAAGPVIYAYITYPDSATTNGNGGCWSSLPAWPHGDIFIDAALSMTSHEHFEAITDPIPGQGWYDWVENTENADKCKWNFAPLRYGAYGNQYMNGHYYTLQNEFSDARFNAGLYPCVGR
jgi:hypothetical protein